MMIEDYKVNEKWREVSNYIKVGTVFDLLCHAEVNFRACHVYEAYLPNLSERIS